MKTHGKTSTPEYMSWCSMKQRCLNPKVSSYSYYGGRGITVCERWRESFENFLADMGPRPEKHSIDRRDPDGNYCPENCRWADKVTQANNCRWSRSFTAFGETRTASEWAQRFGIKRGTLCARVDKGWSVEKSLKTPVQRYHRLAIDGRTSKQWAAGLGIRAHTLQDRIRRGWNLQDAVSRPRHRRQGGKAGQPSGHTHSARNSHETGNYDGRKV